MIITTKKLLDLVEDVLEATPDTLMAWDYGLPKSKWVLSDQSELPNEISFAETMEELETGALMLAGIDYDFDDFEISVSHAERKSVIELPADLVSAYLADPEGEPEDGAKFSGETNFIRLYDYIDYNYNEFVESITVVID